jgi:hypothetical protein
MTPPVGPAQPAGTLIAGIVDRLLAEWPRYFPGATVRPEVSTVTLRTRRLSDIARVELALSGSRLGLYVKAHKKPTSPAERVRHKAGLEFEMLCRLYEGFRGISGSTVVRPVAFFPEEMVVVTEEGTGENLHTLIQRRGRPWSGPAARDRLVASCRAVGHWLGHFQRLTTEPRQAPLPVAQLRAEIAADVEACVGMGLPEAAAQRLLRHVDRDLDAVASREFPVVGEHPDFQPDNILCAPGQVTVLDFTSFRLGSQWSDPGRFLATVAFLGKHPLYRRPLLRRLNRAFLDGYGWGPRPLEPALAVYLVRYMVQAVRTAGTWPLPRFRKRLVAWRAAAFLAAWSRRLGDGSGRALEAGLA